MRTRYDRDHIRFYRESQNQESIRKSEEQIKKIRKMLGVTQNRYERNHEKQNRNIR